MVSLAALQRNFMLGVFGMNATDRTHLAEISIESSLCEIVQAEEDTKQQLRVLIDVVRKRDVARQSAQLKADLVKSSKLRKTLCALQQKRTGMETPATPPRPRPPPLPHPFTLPPPRLATPD